MPFLNNLLIEYFKWNKLKSSEKIPDITFIDELKDKLLMNIQTLFITLLDIEKTIAKN